MPTAIPTRGFHLMPDRCVLLLLIEILLLLSNWRAWPPWQKEYLLHQGD
jgi:hypothetical protein